MNALQTTSGPQFSVADISQMAQAFAASRLFGIKTREEGVALMLIAQAEGLHPATAARDYHIIQGRPALKSDAMLARFQQAGGAVKWEEVSDKRVAATFSHSQGGSVLIDWDMARAKSAGLGGKDMWAKYPRQMLRARVISEGVRTCYPAVLSGLYTPEEVMDMGPAKNADAHVVEELPAITATTEELRQIAREKFAAIQSPTEALEKWMSQLEALPDEQLAKGIDRMKAILADMEASNA